MLDMMFNTNLYGKPIVRCPFCFEPLPYSEKNYFYGCDVCNSRITRLDLLKKKPVSCECGRNAKIYCPHCSNETIKDSKVWNMIPKGILEDDIPYFPFSIAGLPASGKTNYITVMLEKLKNTELELALLSLNEEGKKRQKEQSDLIFGKHEFPPPTTANDKPVPQIWSIQKEHNSRQLSYAFTIYDGAGEHSMGATDQIIINYIRYSEAIIITIDPVFIEHARDKIDPSKVANSERDYFDGKIIPAEFALTEIIKFLRDSKVVTNKKSNKLDIPAAIVLTKFDTILNEQKFERFIDNNNIRSPDNAIKDGKVNTSLLDDRSLQIKSLLQSLGEQNFVRLVELNFQTPKFFGVSSYGETPKNQTELNVTNPYRILDPILWLFHQKEFLD